MVYGILKLLNFAHGDVYMVGAFIGFFILQWLGGPLTPSVTPWLAVAIMGISIERVISFTFFLVSALAAAGGIMFGLVFGQIFSLMGFTAGLKGFTAAVVGGIGSIPGAVLGGFLIGLTEAFATGYLPGGSVYANLYVFALLIVMFLIRPTGLLGSPVIQKV